MFVSCNFSYVHGSATILNLFGPPGPSTYLAIVVQTPRPNGENLNN
jgi:hypothetical protein